jgi:hypothetical protein
MVIRLETGKGMKWKLDAIFVNKEYAFFLMERCGKGLKAYFMQ